MQSAAAPQEADASARGRRADLRQRGAVPFRYKYVHNRNAMSLPSRSRSQKPAGGPWTPKTRIWSWEPCDGLVAH